MSDVDKCVSISYVTARYQETDQMGVIHHSVYPIWFEVGRTDWIKTAGMTYTDFEKNGVMLPLIELTCEYKGYAKYEDELIVKTWLDKLTNTRISFSYEISRKARSCASRNFAWSDARSATQSDAQGATQSDARNATPSDIRNATPSDARNATPSDIRNATQSDARSAAQSDAQGATQNIDHCDTFDISCNAAQVGADNAIIAVGKTFHVFVGHNLKPINLRKYNQGLFDIMKRMETQ